MVDRLVSMDLDNDRLPDRVRQRLADDMADPATVEGASLSATFGRRRMYDVRDFMGSDDIGAAVNRAIAAAGQDAFAYGKAGQVIIPPGNFAQTTEVSWLQGGTTYHGVDLIGSGWGKTVLRPQGSMAAIHHISPSGTDALRDLTVANFEIDGSGQSGAYATLIKGTYMQRLRRVTMDHLYIHDVGATGLGNDFHDGCLIRDVLAVGCGRLNDGSGAGGAGIGIGTGVWTVEALEVISCRTHSNKRAGLFFETQTGLLVEGILVTDHYASSNGEHGIGDAGCRGLQVTGGFTRKNGGSGFATYQGTVSSATPGIAGRVRGLRTVENVANGVHVDWSGRRPGAVMNGYDPITASAVSITPDNLGYTFEGVHARGNTGHGVLAQAGNSAGQNLPDVELVNVLSEHNGKSGVSLSSAGVGSGGAIVRPSLINLRTRNNGQGGSWKYGVLLNANIVNLRYIGGKAWDDQTTPTQSSAVDVVAGITVSGNSRIEGVDMADIAGSIALGGTVDATTTIVGNRGYNNVGATNSVTVGTSPFTYTAGNRPEVVYIDGGSVTAIKRNGLNVFTSTNKTVPLQPGESVDITYSSAPTVRATVE